MYLGIIIILQNCDPMYIYYKSYRCDKKIETLPSQTIS